MKKWNELTKKQKMTTGAVLALLIIGGGVGATTYSNAQAQKQEISETKKTLAQSTKTLDGINSKLESFRQKNNRSFLEKDVKQENVKSIIKELNKLDKTDISFNLNDTKAEGQSYKKQLEETHQLADATEFQLTIQDKVNGLFQSTDKVAINGQEVTKDLSIKDGLKQEDIDTVSKAFNNTKVLEYIPVKEKSVEGPSWQEAIQGLLDDANNQLKIIADTQKLVDALFKDGKPIDTTSDNALKDAEKAIGTIKNDATKKALTDKFNQVKDAVTKKKEADKKSSSTNQQDSSNNQSANAGAGSQGNGQTTTQGNNTGSYAGGNTNQGGGSSWSGSTGGGSNNNYNRPSTGGQSNGSSGGGYANQEQLDQAAINASNADWSGFFK